jgi:hypothetical protein
MRLILCFLIFLPMSACSEVVTSSDGGSTGAGGEEAPPPEPPNGGKADVDECPPDAGARGQVMETCTDDCDCQPGLRCQPCMTTAEHNCADWCHAYDPKCNYGVVTCPVDPGRLCPAVMICQP